MVVENSELPSVRPDLSFAAINQQVNLHSAELNSL
jgi:hypothetical protein